MHTRTVGLVTIAAVATGLIAANFSRFVVAVITPRTSFNVAHVPSPPSYADLTGVERAADARQHGHR